MDSLTQAALGAACGELTLGRHLGNKALLWGALVGTLPDLDVLFSPLFDNAGALAWHRGISHSLIAILLIPVAIAWLLRFIHQRHPQQPSFGVAYGFAILNYSTHVLIDCFTVYGTQLFAPFQDARVALNIMFIIDGFFSLPLVVAPLVYIFFRQNSLFRRRLNAGTLAWCAAYACFAIGMKWKANTYFQNSLHASGETPLRLHTAPTLSNVILWRGLAEIEQGFLISYHSHFAPKNDMRWHFVPKNRSRLSEINDTRGVEIARWFSREYFTVQDHPYQPGSIISDLRFGEFSENGNLHYIFNWEILPSGDLKKLSTARPDPSQLIENLLARLRGHEPTLAQDKEAPSK